MQAVTLCTSCKERPATQARKRVSTRCDECRAKQNTYVRNWRAKGPEAICALGGCSKTFTTRQGKRFCSQEHARQSAAEMLRTHKGTAHGNFKGGRYEDHKGYVQVWIPGKATHERRYEGEHRQVMEGLLGRPLQSYEQVHHVNGVRNDNRPENLELWFRGHPGGQRANDVPTHCPTCTCAIHQIKT